MCLDACLWKNRVKCRDKSCFSNSLPTIFITGLDLFKLFVFNYIRIIRNYHFTTLHL